MKNLLGVISFSLLLLTGCSSISNFLDDALPAREPNIPVALQEQIADKVNPENEIYAVGNAKIDRSGSIIAQAKANNNARQLLKEKLRKEVKINLDSFLLDSDNYSKTIITPVLSDLNDYAVELSLKKATEKGQWEGSESVYSLFAIKRATVLNISKQVFSGYLGDISGKLNNIKAKVNDSIQ